MHPAEIVCLSYMCAICVLEIGFAYEYGPKEHQSVLNFSHIPDVPTGCGNVSSLGCSSNLSLLGPNLMAKTKGTLTIFT